MTEGPFPWPCGRRDAHVDHPGEPVDATSICDLPGSRSIPGRRCPGVKAHPSTMAGGSWASW